MMKNDGRYVSGNAWERESALKVGMQMNDGEMSDEQMEGVFGGSVGMPSRIAVHMAKEGVKAGFTLCRWFTEKVMYKKKSR